jgi:ubiquinone/menaquinone biosynthesis C-methylase UbiE
MYSPKAQKFVPLEPKQWAFACWNRIAPFYAKEWMPVLKPLHEVIAKQCLDELKGEEYPSILDIGSGAGEPAISLATINGKVEIVSADAAATNLRLGLMRAGSGNLIDFVRRMLHDT